LVRQHKYFLNSLTATEKPLINLVIPTTANRGLQSLHSFKMVALPQYNYVFAIGTFFAMLDIWNNGANDVANAWATSVSSRSISYRWAMVLATVFEMLGAITVGARTADTIKNGIIPNSVFRNNAGVQMLAFTCALGAAASWVMWCTRHSAHVSSTYSLISAVAGVGVAVGGASQVSWGWNGGKGMGAIFAGLGMAPLIAGCFGAIIFGLIKYVVHKRSNPAKWAVITSPFFFTIAGTICTLSIVYKGSPELKLNAREPSFIAAVVVGTGCGLGLLSGLFFVPYLYCKIIRRENLPWYMFVMGPALFFRPAPAASDKIVVPNYAVVQHDDEDEHGSAETAVASGSDISVQEKDMVITEVSQAPVKSHAHHRAEADARLHAKLREKKNVLGWAMRTLHENQMGPGNVYEIHNMKIILKRIPAYIVVGALYGLNYDIHAAQTGLAGTPEGDRMVRVYAGATKYDNETEYSYSFVQVITACTASFAHGANDIGNAAGPWAAIYGAWQTGNAAQSKASVPIWQLVVLSGVLSIGLITYGYNIMRVMGNKITYHSPSRGCSMEMGAAITVLVFSQFALPVSTSMCITGATVGVGLMNGVSIDSKTIPTVPILIKRLEIVSSEFSACSLVSDLLDLHHPCRRNTWWCKFIPLELFDEINADKLLRSRWGSF
jgi:sodium-dependent phosphate transporter